MAHGGYREPSRPAPASGPGRLARRTDGGPAQKMRELPNARYGEAQEFREIQRGAGMALEATPSQAAPGGGGGQPAPVIPFGEGTNNPDQPVTTGAPFGAGPGPGSLGITGDERAARAAEKLRPYLPVLEFLANQPDADPDARALVRRVKGALQ